MINASFPQFIPEHRKEGKFLNSFYEDSIVPMPKSYKHSTEKERK
jgi:hypothetical protein